jgi:dTDP-4-amino-4,6-dideoxygalactose transaminase
MTVPPPFDKRITVTRPALPPLEDYCAGLKEIWDNRWLTNSGPVLRRFQAKLEAALGNEVALLANGALALEAALTSLDLHGEVITTAFTFPATANAILRCGLKPVFADVEPEFLTLDPHRVEAAIRPETSAILAVHVYGNPAAVDALADVADRHKLKLVYDAAHAFGTRVGGRSIAQFGDASMFSFHATKPFHSAEGAALAAADPKLLHRVRTFANHGYPAEGEAELIGSNAKMSELHALMGELMLAGANGRRLANKAIANRYRQGLAEVHGIAVLPDPAPDIEPSHAFFPILVNADAFGMDANGLQRRMAELNVETRRYFAPAIADLAPFKDYRAADPLTVSRTAADQVLTLPIYADLPLGDVDRIIEMLAALGRE